MSYINRYVETPIKEDLIKKMVFISGPRQSGKTTLAQKIMRDIEVENNISRYLNWDNSEDRENIIRERFPAGKGVLVLDEIHKYSRWRQIVKGLYDKRKDELKIIVTGSGKLDYYKHGGDSLQGRYHSYRLYPFTFGEIQNKKDFTLKDLMLFGGFPEQLIAKSERETRRWGREYRSRLIQEDLNTLENVKDIGLLEHLSLRLPELVGSPLSINSLRQDLQVSHQTVTRWLAMLENIYMIFRIYPFGAPKIRAVKKEAKHYLYDWTNIEEGAYRFENMVACHLLKWCHFRQDYEGLDTELRYFRDVDRREVDFVIFENNKPILFLECKLKNREVNTALRYLKRRFPGTDAIQIALNVNEDYVNKDGIRICSAEEFLQNLN